MRVYQRTNGSPALHGPPLGTKSKAETVTRLRASPGSLCPGAEGSDFGPSPKQPLGSSQPPSRLLEPRPPPDVPSPGATWQRAHSFPSTSHAAAWALGVAQPCVPPGLCWALSAHRDAQVTTGKHAEWSVTSTGGTGEDHGPEVFPGHLC